MAAERVRDGGVLRPSSLLSASFERRSRSASQPGIGMEALDARPVTGRPRSLTPQQEQQVFRWVNGKDPRQYGLGFGLWTRRVVADLIERKFAIRLGVMAVGELLAKLGLTPQKPLQRAYQRDPEAIEKRQREVFPRVAREARSISGRSPDFAPTLYTARPWM